MHDLVIENARIVDGTGGPSRHGSVAVRDGRIVEVGGPPGQIAQQRLQADGRVVAPGFIDPHGRDRQLWRRRGAVPAGDARDAHG
jgi:N-acyl-D-aspartate/D-glutamate deacylase